MRCFFHLVRGSEKIIDEDGIVVADLDQARREGLTAIGELIQDGAESGTDWRGWRLEICDQFDRTYVVLDFDQLIELCGCSASER